MSANWRRTTVAMEKAAEVAFRREQAAKRRARMDKLIREGLPMAVIQERMDATRDEVRHRLRALKAKLPHIDEWLGVR